MISQRLIVAFLVTMFLVGCATMKLPGQSGANSILQRDASQMVMLLESVEDNTCKQSKIINTEIVDYPKNPGKDPWTERWTVDRCGKLVYYRVVFTPSPGGGTDFGVNLWN
jgi:hypothetical protein